MRTTGATVRRRSAEIASRGQEPHIASSTWLNNTPRATQNDKTTSESFPAATAALRVGAGLRVVRNAQHNFSANVAREALLESLLRVVERKHFRDDRLHVSRIDQIPEFDSSLRFGSTMKNISRTRSASALSGTGRGSTIVTRIPVALSTSLDLSMRSPPTCRAPGRRPSRFLRICLSRSQSLHRRPVRAEIPRGSRTL